ncbi:MAG: PaREP1 family protein [Pyrobaculum sp.]
MFVAAASKRGVDVDKLTSLLDEVLSLEDLTTFELRKRVAKMYLELGLEEKDPTQASKLLYEAAKTAIKAAALALGISKKEWKFEDYEDAAIELKRLCGVDVASWWTTAAVLYDWGLENIIEQEDIDIRVSDIIELVQLLDKLQQCQKNTAN